MMRLPRVHAFGRRRIGRRFQLGSRDGGRPLQLDNLTAILDHNTLQITGRTRDVCSNEPVDEKFRAFGWTVRHADGHDLAELEEALRSSARDGRPTFVIADTVKGRGVSFMEDVVKWHHGVPSENELETR